MGLICFWDVSKVLREEVTCSATTNPKSDGARTKLLEINAQKVSFSVGFWPAANLERPPLAR